MRTEVAAQAHASPRATSFRCLPIELRVYILRLARHPRLVDWYVSTTGVFCGYLDPCLSVPILHGFVYNHPNPDIKDGDEINTSALVSLSSADQRATTHNRTYILGNPTEAYCKWFYAQHSPDTDIQLGTIHTRTPYTP